MYRDLKGRDKSTGNWPLVSSPSKGFVDLPVQIPCGRCIHCRLNTAMSKTVRLTHEMRSWETASFLTLTYDPDNLVYGDRGIPTLTRGQQGHMTLFFKRLRKHLIGLKVKYFQCAEYGEKGHRPHHHCILFGYDFSDDRSLVPGSIDLYRSPTLDRIWSYGACAIGSVTWDSASYVASYSVKKLTGEQGKKAYDECGILPPYMTSSLGIGQKWIENWLYDVYPRDWIVVKGHKIKPPRYYDEALLRRDPALHRKVMLNRQKQEFDEDKWMNAVKSLAIKEKELEFYKNPKI